MRLQCRRCSHYKCEHSTVLELKPTAPRAWNRSMGHCILTWQGRRLLRCIASDHRMPCSRRSCTRLHVIASLFPCQLANGLHTSRTVSTATAVKLPRVGAHDALVTEYLPATRLQRQVCLSTELSTCLAQTPDSRLAGPAPKAHSIWCFVRACPGGAHAPPKAPSQ